MPTIPSLSGSYIDQTYHRLVQVSGSSFADGDGNPITLGPPGAVNPTPTYLPFNSAGTFQDSFLNQSGSILKTISGGIDNGLRSDFANKEYQLGNYNSGNNTYIGLYDSYKVAALSALNGIYIGDADSNQHGIVLYIDDTNKVIKTTSAGVDIGLYLDFANDYTILGTPSSPGDFEGKGYMALNSLTNTYPQIRIGDFDFNTNPGNRTHIEINDQSQIIETSNQESNIGLKLDFNNRRYTLGDPGAENDAHSIQVRSDGPYPGILLSYFDSTTLLHVGNDLIRTVQEGTDIGLKLDFGNNIYQIGNFTTGSITISGSQVQLTGSAFTWNNRTVASIDNGTATYIPFFSTNNILSTSSIYQSGSNSIIINSTVNTTANPEALYVQQTHPTSFNVISGKGNLNNYLQLNIHNTNTGTTSSSDIVATANNGDENSNYIDIGINGNNFTGSLGKANDAYLYSTGNDLHIGNASNKPLQLFAGGLDTDANRKLQLNPNNSHQMTGSLDISGSLAIRNLITSSVSNVLTYNPSTGQVYYTASSAIGGGGSGTPVAILDEGTQLTPSVTSINFTGAGVAATNVGNAVTVTINGTSVDTSTFATTGSNTFKGNQTVTGSLFTTGSNTLIGITTLTGSLKITGSQTITGYTQYIPTNPNIDNSISASYIYVSGSTNDLYFAQNGNGYSNNVRLRWLEGGSLYTGILQGGILSSTPGTTTFKITSGSGLIVTMNASTGSEPYPTAQYISWPEYNTQPITYSGSAKITYVGISSAGTIIQQTVPWGTNDINQWDNSINLGVVLHLSGSVSTGVFNAPQISYGGQQKTDDFFRAFGPLKISGHTLRASGSSPTLSIIKDAGTSYREGANYVINPNHPSTVVENSINTSKIYRYRISGSTPIIDTGINNAGYTEIDSKYYVDTTTGQLALVGGAYWSIQRVFWIPNSPTNAFIVYYGNDRYRSLVDATNARDSEPFIEAPNTAQNAIFVGYIIIQGGGSGTPPRDLLNASEATIIPAGLFRNVGGIGSSGTNFVSTTLAGLADVSISSPQNNQLLAYNTTLTKWQNVTAITASVLGNVDGTATTASYVANAQTASYVLQAVSASYASLAQTANTASYVANAQTASYVANAQTASYVANAQTASYVANAISSSYAYTASVLLGTATSAVTASYANTFAIQSTLTDFYAISPSTNAGVNSLFTKNTGSFTSAFGKYTVYSGSNSRAGEFVTSWNGTTVSYYDNATVDIGSTTGVTFTSAIVSGQIQINTGVATPSGWQVKMLATFM